MIAHTVLALLAASTALAVDVARVCQSSSAYAPPIGTCTGYKDAITKAYPKGTIFNSDPYNGCQKLYDNFGCAISLCAFPRQGISVSNLTATIDDILNNCRTTPAGSTITYTGGYSIIKGTNATIGVYGNLTPLKIVPAAVTSGSALTSDCNNIFKSLTASSYKQTDPSGCTVLAQSGTCTMSFCDVANAQVTKDELSYMALSFLSQGNTKNNGRTAGFIEFSEANQRRLHFYGTANPTSASSDEVLCVNSTASPAQTDCTKASQALSDKYGASITMDQKNVACKRINTAGGCQINLCAPYGSTVPTSKVQSAITSITNKCVDPSISSHSQGYARISGTLATISTSGTQVLNNVWCNPAPNNSPKQNDAIKVWQTILSQPNALYIANATGSSQGCNLLFSNGTAKISYCAPPGTTISGKDLSFAAIGIIGQCGSGDYSSGILHLTPYESVTIYDPPNPGNFPGNIGCDAAKFNDYPDPADCNKALSMLYSTLGDSNHNSDSTVQLPGGSDRQCNQVVGFGSCEIDVCAGKGYFFTPYVVPARLVANLALEIVSFCTYSGSDSKLHTQGVTGVRSGYAGDWQVKVLKIGTAGTKDELKKRAAGGVATLRRNDGTPLEIVTADRVKEIRTPTAIRATKTKRLPIPQNPEYTQLPGTNIRYKLEFEDGDSADKIPQPVIDALAQGMKDAAAKATANTRMISYTIGVVEGYDAFTGARVSLMLDPATANGTGFSNFAGQAMYDLIEQQLQKYIGDNRALRAADDQAHEYIASFEFAFQTAENSSNLTQYGPPL